MVSSLQNESLEVCSKAQIGLIFMLQELFVYSFSNAVDSSKMLPEAVL